MDIKEHDHIMTEHTPIRNRAFKKPRLMLAVTSFIIVTGGVLALNHKLDQSLKPFHYTLAERIGYYRRIYDGLNNGKPWKTAVAQAVTSTYAKANHQRILNVDKQYDEREDRTYN